MNVNVSPPGPAQLLDRPNENVVMEAILAPVSPLPDLKLPDMDKDDAVAAQAGGVIPARLHGPGRGGGGERRGAARPMARAVATKPVPSRERFRMMVRSFHARWPEVSHYRLVIFCAGAIM